MKRILFSLMILAVLTSCIGGFYEFMAARYVKPDEARRYKPKGALVFGTIDKENAPFVSLVYFMIRDSQDVTLSINQDFTFFVFDVGRNAKGFTRIGMRYYAFGTDFWINKDLNFNLEENKLNYLGRFIFYQKDILKTYRMVWTNLIEEDVKNLGDFYPDLTNMEVKPVEIKEGMYYLY
ncbi:MAG: hypothetical protein ACP5QT_04845 [Brevinematia bacterium]